MSGGIDHANANHYYYQMDPRDRPPSDSRSRPQSGMETRSVPRIASRELMRNEPELIIEHDGREYRLRITHRGKLILTA